jgi:hypothetical protein
MVLVTVSLPPSCARNTALAGSKVTALARPSLGDREHSDAVEIIARGHGAGQEQRELPGQTSVAWVIAPG